MSTDMQVKFSVDVEQKELAEALEWAARALPARAANPAFAGVRVRTEDDQLVVSATDGEQSARASVTLPDIPTETLDVVVPGLLLVNLVKALPKGVVTFTREGDGQLTVTGKRSTFGLPVMPAANVPTVPDMPPVLGVMSAQAFSMAVHTVAQAASRDDLLPVLTGVQVTLDPATQTASFAATDRYRLAEMTIPYTPEPGAAAFAGLIKAKTLDTYAKGADQDGYITWHSDNDAIAGVTASGRTATTRQLSGEFPDYKKLITAAESEHTLSVPIADTLDAVKRVALVIDQHSGPVKLSVSGSTVVLSAAGTADGAEAGDTVDDATLTGLDEFTISFNPSLLTDALNAAEGNTATFAITSSSKAVLLRNTGQDDPNLTYLLMPMKA